MGDTFSAEHIKQLYDNAYVDWEYPTLASGLKMLHYYLGALESRHISLPNHTRRLLDVGCGPGFDTACWAKLGMEAIGVDLSPQGILKGHRTWGKLADFVVADARNLCFPHHSIDLIFVKGCSLTNTPDLASIRAVAAHYLEYLAPLGVLLWIAHSDLSGTAPTRWLNHTPADLKQMFAGLKARVVGPLYVTRPVRRLYRMRAYRVIPRRLWSQLEKLFCSVGPWSYKVRPVEYIFVIVPNNSSP